MDLTHFWALLTGIWLGWCSAVAVSLAGYCWLRGRQIGAIEAAFSEGVEHGTERAVAQIRMSQLAGQQFPPPPPGPFGARQ